MPNTLNSKENTSTKSTPTKVFVGMSGGVDSSVAALLLKNEGYDVTGVFIKVWQPDETECGWKDERRDAMRVAALLDIPFETIDLSETYKKEVADYMIEEYKKGRTPNPDIMCNRYVKFGGFWEYAKAHGASYIATGHYANRIIEDGQAKMCESKDSNKDQTYFLWTLTHEDLEHVLFPIGHLEKDEVRRIAEKNKLPVFNKKDSQGVCFIGHLDMKEFLKQYVHTEKGKVLDIHGNTIGEHEGAILYTLGERHGFTIHTSTTSSKPVYVIQKNIEENTITVGSNQEYDQILASDQNLHTYKLSKSTCNIEGSISCTVRIRHRQEKQPCVLQKEPNGTYTVHFKTPQKGLALGQSAVFYSGTHCIGGGILEA